MYLLVVGGRLRRRLLTTAVFVLMFAVPVLAYAGYNAAGRGQFELTTRGPASLYARVATVADCSTLALPAYERQLCPAQMHVTPKKGSLIDGYFFKVRATTITGLPRGVSTDEAMRDFSLRVITQQPADVARAVGGDILHGFSWNKTRQIGRAHV